MVEQAVKVVQKEVVRKKAPSYSFTPKQWEMIKECRSHLQEAVRLAHELEPDRDNPEWEEKYDGGRGDWKARVKGIPVNLQNPDGLPRKVHSELIAYGDMFPYGIEEYVLPRLEVLREAW